MKRYISILITITMIISLFSIQSFAKNDLANITDEEIVYQEMGSEFKAYIAESQSSTLNEKELLSNFTIIENKGIRTVTDNRTGGVATYDINKQILTYSESDSEKAITIDVASVINQYSSKSSNSTWDNDYAYSTSGSGNNKLWTLQIPSKVKVTYEQSQGATINSFVGNVDSIEAAESNLIVAGGAVVVTLFGMAVPALALIIAIVGGGGSLTAIIGGFNTRGNAINAAKDDYNDIVVYSQP